jgi:hypothetical protein
MHFSLPSPGQKKHCEMRYYYEIFIHSAAGFAKRTAKACQGPRGVNFRRSGDSRNPRESIGRCGRQRSARNEPLADDRNRRQRAYFVEKVVEQSARPS